MLIRNAEFNSECVMRNAELMLDLSPSLSTIIFHTAQTIVVVIKHDFTNNSEWRVCQNENYRSITPPSRLLSQPCHLPYSGGKC